MPPLFKIKIYPCVRFQAIEDLIPDSCCVENDELRKLVKNRILSLRNQDFDGMGSYEVYTVLCEQHRIRLRLKYTQSEVDITDDIKDIRD